MLHENVLARTKYTPIFIYLAIECEVDINLWHVHCIIVHCGVWTMHLEYPRK